LLAAGDEEGLGHSHLSSDQRSTLAIRRAGIARPEMFASD
jgi:hypothetical protein